jgi:hypothetical protein
LPAHDGHCNRTFTLITTLTLSLGVALDTTVFSVVNAVLLLPLRTIDWGGGRDGREPAA